MQNDILTFTSLCDILKSKSRLIDDEKTTSLDPLYLYKNVIYNNGAEINIPNSLCITTDLSNSAMSRRFSGLVTLGTKGNNDFNVQVLMREVFKLLTLYSKNKFRGVEKRSENILSQFKIDNIRGLVTNKYFGFIAPNQISKLKESSDSKILTTLLLRCFLINDNVEEKMTPRNKILLPALLHINNIPYEDFTKIFNAYKFTKQIQRKLGLDKVIDLLSKIHEDIDKTKTSDGDFAEIQTRYDIQFISDSSTISPQNDIINLIGLYIDAKSVQPEVIPSIPLFKKITNLLISVVNQLAENRSDLAMEIYEKACSLSKDAWNMLTETERNDTHDRLQKAYSLIDSYGLSNKNQHTRTR